MLHPATHILLFIITVVAGQRLPASALGVATLVLAVCASRAIGVRRFSQLIKRTRFLLLAIVAVYLFTGAETTLGERALAAGVQALRLTFVIAALGCLIASLPAAALVTGVFTLLQPLARLGAPIERIAVRLTLTLRYLEAAPALSWRELIQRLQLADGANSAGETIVLARAGWSWRDALILAAAAGAAAHAVVTA